MDKNLLKDTENYWTNRADGYSQVNQEELSGVQHENWKDFLVQEIERHYPGHQPSEIHILDIGCGPGFFSVILTECGYAVTAIDYTQAMLEEAKENAMAQGVQDRITFQQMDAQDLCFSDAAFEVIVSRNLTWNLQEPERAYREWCRVLKKNGLLLNFDAEYAKGAHNLFLPENKAHNMMSDPLKEECHDIYHMLSISTLERPDWDLQVLRQVGFSEVSVDKTVGSRIYVEMDEFHIPDAMFGIVARK